jgi:hypothetical protein
MSRFVPNGSHLIVVATIVCTGAIGYRLSAQSSRTLSATFTRRVMAAALPEAPFDLRFFTGAVKTNSEGRIITGPDDDPVKTLVGAEFAGERAGLQRFTKILFGVDYFNGRPDPGTRIDPNNPQVSSGKQHWPFVPQPFRSWPNALAVTPDGAKVYVTLPGREGYPDWRVAVITTATRSVRWISLRPEAERYDARHAADRRRHLAAEPVNLPASLRCRPQPVRELRVYHRYRLRCAPG